YTPGDGLDAAWRELVASTLSLEDDALLAALVDWTPPADLQGEKAEVARRMDEFLSSHFDTTALRARTLGAQAEAEALDETLGEIRGLEGLALLTRLEALSGLSESLSELGPRVRVVVDDHLEVDAGTEINSSLLVVDGTLEVHGTIRGDVLVVDGEVELRPGSRITGALSLAESTLDDEGGAVEGGIRELAPNRDRLQSQLREEIRRELRNELRQDRGDSRDWGMGRPFSRIFRGFGNLFGDLFNILVLGLIGAAFFHFAGANVEAVAETARNSTGRAALVGLSGAALVLPVFILGIVGLAVTIIGIPAILLWVPLFPAAVLLAVLMGYVAVARNLGVWLEKQRYPYTEWIRLSNPVTLVFGGLLVLMAPFLAAHILGMVGFLGFFSVLLKVSGVILTLFVAAVGLGSVLLTRGGRKPEEWGTEMFTRSWRERRWGRERDYEAEAFDAELGADEPEAPEAPEAP
ncbi:MAG TPA: hypothetical protein VLA43_10315, partial [Longimicrobiales bacterium]|nr:hypothetical protein [Longimicrobiales bacterium]